MWGPAPDLWKSPNLLSSNFLHLGVVLFCSWPRPQGYTEALTGPEPRLTSTAPRKCSEGCSCQHGLRLAIVPTPYYGAQTDYTLENSGEGKTYHKTLVSKCSATLASVAAPPPGARQGFGVPNYPRHPTGGSGMGCDRGLWGGVWLRHPTPATHSKLQKEPRRGCSYSLEREATGTDQTNPTLFSSIMVCVY